MGKNLKGKEIGKVFAKERTDYIPQDLLTEQVKDTKNVFHFFRKLATG